MNGLCLVFSKYICTKIKENCEKSKKTSTLDLENVHTGLANTIDAEIYVGENIHGLSY